MEKVIHGVWGKPTTKKHQGVFMKDASNKQALTSNTKEVGAGDSYLEAKKRFSKLNKSLKYPSIYRAGNSHDTREKNAILKSLNYLSPQSRVLDLPCGTGRLTKLLVERGYKVKGADVSTSMARMAAKTYQEYTKMESTKTAPVVDFDVVDIMRTNYIDKEFDAVICNRLFHHFTESETRLTALRELRRITSEVVVISFFNSRSFDACWRRIRNWMRMRHPKDRLPVSPKQFESELNAAGFKMVACISSRPLISQLSYVVARPIPLKGEVNVS